MERVAGEPHGHPFSAVDDQAAPDSWVAVLDRVRQEPFYRAYKARAVALLAPRPGRRYLEVGGGTGDDARELAARSGASVVMVDRSLTMARVARRRGLDRVAAGDAHALPIRDGAVDGCLADRTFQHLADPAAALAELVRVTRPGGRLVVADPDHDTQVVDVADQALARRVLRYRADRLLRNGTLAHRTAGLFVTAGLSEVQVEPMTLVVRDHRAVDGVLGLRSWAEAAHQAGLLDADDAARWPELFDEAVASGRFLYAVTFFLTAGTRPAGAGPR